MVHQWTCRVEPVMFRPHQLEQCLERVSVVVEHENLFTDTDQLNTDTAPQHTYTWFLFNRPIFYSYPKLGYFRLGQSLKVNPWGFLWQNFDTVDHELLRSADRGQQLVVPRYRLTTAGRRAFSCAGPSAWNSLSEYLKDESLVLDSFKHSLKCFVCYVLTQRIERIRD